MPDQNCPVCKEWVYDCNCGDEDHCGEGCIQIHDEETNTVILLVHVKCHEEYLENNKK